MALDDAATLVIGAGNFYTAPVGTAKPADVSTAAAIELAGWENVGHTSLEDILTSTSEGGEATVIGTLQNKSLRTTYSARTETLGFTLQQFDEAGLKLYYGSNCTIAADGDVQVASNPVPTSAAFLAVFIDGANHFTFYAPKTELYRSDDPSFADTESLAGLPIGVKPLQHNTNAWTFAVSPLGAGAGA